MARPDLEVRAAQLVHQLGVDHVDQGGHVPRPRLVAVQPPPEQALHGPGSSSYDQPMPAFGDAARRHLAAAEHLVGDEQHDDADHLAGLAAECGIKAILCGPGGVQTPASGPPESSGTKFQHLPKLWADASSHLHGRLSGLGVRVAANLLGPNPFDTWQVYDRYSASGTVTAAGATAHVGSARLVVRLVEDLAIAGVPV